MELQILINTSDSEFSAGRGTKKKTSVNSTHLALSSSLSLNPVMGGTFAAQMDEGDEEECTKQERNRGAGADVCGLWRKCLCKQLMELASCWGLGGGHQSFAQCVDGCK